MGQWPSCDKKSATAYFKQNHFQNFLSVGISTNIRETFETSEDFAGLRFREWPGRACKYDFCGYNLKSNQGGGKFITSLARAKRHHSFTGSTPSFIHCHNCPPFSNTNTFHKCQQYTQMYTKYFLESCYYLFTC